MSAPILPRLHFREKTEEEKTSPVVSFAIARANEQPAELEKKRKDDVKDRDFLSGFITALFKDSSNSQVVG
jgi:hypothetical protein